MQVSRESEVTDAEMTRGTQKEVIGFDISMDVSEPGNERRSRSQRASASNASESFETHLWQASRARTIWRNDE